MAERVWRKMFQRDQPKIKHIFQLDCCRFDCKLVSNSAHRLGCCDMQHIESQLNGNQRNESQRYDIEQNYHELTNILNNNLADVHFL